MSLALLALAILLSLLIGANLVRVALGPTFFDRLLGVGVIGTNAVLLLVLIGFIFERPEGFMDLAITYAMLNFIGVVGVAKFLDLKQDAPALEPAEEGGVPRTEPDEKPLAFGRKGGARPGTAPAPEPPAGEEPPPPEKDP